MSDQSGALYRLPTEAEWEAAARGAEGRAYAFGNDLGPLRCNYAGTHLRRPSPVGVFCDGHTPDGIADLTGNVFELTSSLFGESADAAHFSYPYRADDGREELARGATWRRVARGGCWSNPPHRLLASRRVPTLPDFRGTNVGLRLVRSG